MWHDRMHEVREAFWRNIIQCQKRVNEVSTIVMNIASYLLQKSYKLPQKSSTDAQMGHLLDEQDISHVDTKITLQTELMKQAQEVPLNIDLLLMTMRWPPQQVIGYQGFHHCHLNFIKRVLYVFRFHMCQINR